MKLVLLFLVLLAVATAVPFMKHGKKEQALKNALKEAQAKRKLSLKKNSFGNEKSVIAKGVSQTDDEEVRLAERVIQKVIKEIHNEGMANQRMLGNKNLLKKSALHKKSVNSRHKVSLEGSNKISGLVSRLLSFGTSNACNDDEFTCMGGTCISDSLVCDDSDDCPFGDDEGSCSTCDGFLCMDGTTCISNSSVCDGIVDCDSIVTEDENDCPCADDEYTCMDGTCINNSLVCDGQIDCGDFFQDDELQCPCEEDEFKCFSLTGACINSTQVCDGQVDCEDAFDSDEACSNTTDGEVCDFYHFACPEECIDLSLRCDNTVDCSDGSDEENCITGWDYVTGKKQCTGWVCLQEDEYVCLDTDYVCDDTYHCDDLTDEINIYC